MRATCVKMVYELAKRDDRVVFIGSDLSPGLLKEMQEDYPDRYFMEGVYEANLIGMAAGLAMEGYIPYFNTIATFITRRCFEQIAVDLCMHDLPVRLIGNGGGVVYAPLGPTHLATEDISIMRALPNMTIVAVSDAEEMKRFMLASIDWPHPIYIRLGKGGEEVVPMPNDSFEIGKAITVYQTNHTEKTDVLLISTGVMTQRVIKVAQQIEKMSLRTRVLHFHTIKPLDEVCLLQHAKHTQLLVTIEENSLIGGLGSAVTDCLVASLGRSIPLIKRYGLPDRFPDKYGSQEQLLNYYGLTVEHLVEKIKTTFMQHFVKRENHCVSDQL
ncbi:MAG: transketolase [Gammaproteobacteria bacterium]|nr:transketolase [Gammaproteobacteria bacterium]